MKRRPSCAEMHFCFLHNQDSPVSVLSALSIHYPCTLLPLLPLILILHTPSNSLRLHSRRSSRARRSPSVRPTCLLPQITVKMQPAFSSIPSFLLSLLTCTRHMNIPRNPPAIIISPIVNYSTITNYEIHMHFW